MNQVKFFTAIELKNFFNTIENDNSIYSVRNEALFKIMYYFALKISEVSNLKKNDFDGQKGELTLIRNGVTSTLKIIDENILTSLVRYLKNPCPCGDNEYMFPSSNGKKLDRRTIDGLFKQYCSKAKIKDTAKWHTLVLRHSRAFVLVGAGLTPSQLKYWLGFKLVSSTDIYFKFTEKEQEQLYLKLRKSGELYK